MKAIVCKEGGNLNRSMDTIIVGCKESCRDDSVQGLVMECACVYMREREIVDTQRVKTQRIEYAS